MKKLLMVAYHFPPLAGSSGIQRTLRFAQHLPSLGWEPLVLTAHPRAYERTSADLSNDVPAGTIVRRAQAWDTARHLAFKGRYVAAMARPDRWASWRFDAVRQGMQLIRQYKPKAIVSTYPIATAHLIAAELQCRSGLPWVADFRDPMAQEGYPADPVTWQQYSDIERHALHTAAASTFTTPGAAAEYRQRYPAAASRVHLLENGYDESSFAGIDFRALEAAGPLNPGAVTVLHSGIVYPSERDPTQLMAALRLLHDAGTVQPGRLKLRFRAPVADALLHSKAAEFGVGDYIEVFPPVAYRDALAEMLRADALLIMQASNCNAQVPAKVYEYLRADRPILCLADPAGDTAGLVRAAGIDGLAPLNSAQEIAVLIQRFMQPAFGGLKTRAQSAYVATTSREHRARQFVALLGQVAT